MEDGPATGARYRTISDHQIEYRMEFRRNGIETTKANKGAGSVSVSVDHLKRLFRDNQILIDESCHGLIEELAALEWERDPSNYDSMEESIKKINDDLADCLRYIVLDMYAPKEAQEAVQL
jgi:phage terminase large subunit